LSLDIQLLLPLVSGHPASIEGVMILFPLPAVSGNAVHSSISLCISIVLWVHPLFSVFYVLLWKQYTIIIMFQRVFVYVHLWSWCDILSRASGKLIHFSILETRCSGKN
jgi:hypothetical protein